MTLTVVLVAGCIVAFALVATYVWSVGRHRKAIEALQLVVAEALREAQQQTFLFVIAADATAVNIKLPADTATLTRFRDILEPKLALSSKNLRVSVALLEENLDHLPKGVVVWGQPGGDVHVACRGL